MNGSDRRTKIIEILKESKAPVSGTLLASKLGVSRQIVVGDIALIRANGTDILSTNNGYILTELTVKTKQYRIYVKHKLEDTYDEFCTILDEGAIIKDEGIVHNVYGEIVVPLNISNRADAKRHTEKLLDGNGEDLMILTGNSRFHTIEADSDLTLLRVQRSLHEKGYLVRQ